MELILEEHLPWTSHWRLQAEKFSLVPLLLELAPPVPSLLLVTKSGKRSPINHVLQTDTSYPFLNSGKEEMQYSRMWLRCLIALRMYQQLIASFSLLSFLCVFIVSPVENGSGAAKAYLHTRLGMWLTPHHRISGGVSAPARPSNRVSDGTRPPLLPIPLPRMRVLAVPEPSITTPWLVFPPT